MKRFLAVAALLGDIISLLFEPAHDRGDLFTLSDLLVDVAPNHLRRLGQRLGGERQLSGSGDGVQQDFGGSSPLFFDFQLGEDTGIRNQLIWNLNGERCRGRTGTGGRTNGLPDCLNL